MNKRLKRLVMAVAVLPFLATGASHASNLDGSFFPAAPKANVGKSDAPILMAQAGDPRVSQLVEQIRLRIVSGSFLPGERLQSVRDMAAEAGVNPNTMQRALQELEREEHADTGM